MRTFVITLIALLSSTLSGCHDDDTPLATMAREARGAHKGFAPAIPILRVANLRASQRYYRDVLGFKVEWDYGDPPDFGEVKRGDAVYFLCQQCQTAGPAWSFVFVDDIDGLYRELTAKNAIIKRPPTNEPWNLREMQVADVDGNVIRFAGNADH